jgi:3-oxoadipate enol-lactonase
MEKVNYMDIRYLTLLMISLLLFGGKSGAAEISVNGRTLNYETAGKGETVVLIHGGLVDSRMWDNQFHAFSKSHRVIRYDLPGFGKSAPPQDTFAPVEDLHTLLTALNVKKCTLIGVSYGGQIAIEYTLAHPEMVKSLIPVASALKGYPYKPGGDRSMIFRAATENRVEDSINLWLKDPIFQAVINYPDAAEKMRIMLRDNFVAWSSNALAKNQWPSFRTIDLLPQIAARTLVIAGEHDNPNILEIADLLVEKIPNARKVTIAGTDHHPNMEEFEEFNRVVLEFLKLTTEPQRGRWPQPNP